MNYLAANYRSIKLIYPNSEAYRDPFGSQISMHSTFEI